MSREVAFDGGFLQVVVDDGKEIVVHGPAVAIVAVDRDDVVTLVRQSRPAVGGAVLEIPAGGIEPGEAPLAAARRELREETGLGGGEWTEVATFFTTPGFCDERMHLFVATGLDQGEASPEEARSWSSSASRPATCPRSCPSSRTRRPSSGCWRICA